MGLLTGLLTLPLAPVRGTVWIAELLQEQAERELRDPDLIERQLQAADEAYDRGELTEDEHAEIEEELLSRLLSRGGS